MALQESNKQRMSDLNQIQTAIDRHFNQKGDRIVFWNDHDQEFPNTLPFIFLGEWDEKNLPANSRFTLRPKNLIMTAIDKAFGVGESTGQDKSMLICKLFRVQPYIPERTQPPEKME